MIDYTQFRPKVNGVWSETQIEIETFTKYGVTQTPYFIRFLSKKMIKWFMLFE